jgi:hypothetical protein
MGKARQMAAIKCQGDRHVSLGGNIQKAENMLSYLKVTFTF